MFAPNIWVFLACRVFQSVGSSSLIPIAVGVIRDTASAADPRALERDVGTLSIAPNLGGAIGPVVGGLVAQHCGGWRAVFLVLAAAGALLFIAVFLGVPETLATPLGERPSASPVTTLRELRHKEVRLSCAVSSALHGCLFFSFVIVAVDFREKYTSREGLLGLMMLPYTVGSTLGAKAFASLAKYALPNASVAALAALGSGAAFAATGWATAGTLPVAAPLGLLAAFGFGEALSRAAARTILVRERPGTCSSVMAVERLTSQSYAAAASAVGPAAMRLAGTGACASALAAVVAFAAVVLRASPRAAGAAAAVAEAPGEGSRL